MTDTVLLEQQIDRLTEAMLRIGEAIKMLASAIDEVNERINSLERSVSAP